MQHRGPALTSHVDIKHFASPFKDRSCSNRNIFNQKILTTSQYGADIEEFDDEEYDDGNGITRNSRFSRSIRRAYGAGRISVFDVGNGKLARSSRSDVVDTPKTNQIDHTVKHKH